MFPGSQSLRYATRLESTLIEVQQYLFSIRFKRGWLTDINIRYNFSSPIRVDELAFDVERHQATLIALSKGAYDVFSDIYSTSTIDELIEQIINPVLRELNDMEKSARILMGIRVWPRRPIPYGSTNNSDMARKIGTTQLN